MEQTKATNGTMTQEKYKLKTVTKRQSFGPLHDEETAKSGLSKTS